MHRMIIAALTIVVLCAAGPIDAQVCDAKLDEFRIELDFFVADLYKTSEFDVYLDEITDEQLYDLCLVFDRSPSLIEAPNALAEAMRSMGDGPKWHPCLGSAEQSALLATVLLSEILAGLLDTHCSVQGCVDISGLACAVTCASSGVFKIMEVIAELLYTLQDHACLQVHFDKLDEVDENVSGTDSVGSYVDTLKTEITSNLDAEISTRASQTSIDGVVVQVGNLDTKLGNPRTADITGDLAAISADLADQKANREAFQDFKLRLTIEFQLQQPDVGGIASLRLPRSMGGKLEDVRETAAAAISMHMAAGESVNNAFHFFDQGDDHFNNQAYGRAFDNYRTAYQEAVKEGDDT